MRVCVGETFSETLTMTPDAAKAFSRAARDFNPLHHDETAAANSRYGKLIVSGTQMAAHLMALTATHFRDRGEAVGLDFVFEFPPAFIALALAGTVVLALGVMIAPLRRAANLKPGDALRHA